MSLSFAECSSALLLGSFAQLSSPTHCKIHCPLSRGWGSHLVQTLAQAEAALRGLIFDYFLDLFFSGKWRLVKGFSFSLVLWFCIFFQDFSCMSLFTPNTVTLMITFNMFRFWQFEHVECLSFCGIFYTWACYGRGICGCIMQCLNVAYCFV